MPAETREALLDATERAILAGGFAGLSTRGIAREAGVPLSLVHYHFGGKEGLLVALVERARDRGHASVREALAGEGSAQFRAAAALAAARAVLLDGGTGIRLNLEMAVAALHNEPLRAEVQRLYRDALTTLSWTAAMIAADSGAPGSATIRPDAAAALLLAAGFGLALQRMLDVEVDAAGEAFDTLSRLLLRQITDAENG